MCLQKLIDKIHGIILFLIPLALHSIVDDQQDINNYHYTLYIDDDQQDFSKQINIVQMTSNNMSNSNYKMLSEYCTQQH